MALLERLTGLLGGSAVVTSREELDYFAEDTLGSRGRVPMPSTRPLAVVRPGSAADVAAVLRLASEAGVPVVPYGSGTGLMGGARSLQPGLVLDTSRLNGIEVRPADRLAWVGAGAVLADVDREARKHGLCVGHDPWTFPVASVGGALSTNGLGYKGGRYGGIGDQVLGLEAALSDGTLLRSRAVRRHSAGPRYDKLFLGAEGTLGVITAVALELFPVPEKRQLLGFRFDAFEAGFGVIESVAALGLRPCLLDYGEEHASPWPQLTWRQDEPPVLYLGFEGCEEEVDAVTARASKIAHAAAGQRIADAEVKRFWDERHVNAQRFSRASRLRRNNRSPDLAFDYMHVALPPSCVLDFRELCHRKSAASGVALLECGLWIAPDFFSCVLALPAALGGHEKLTAVMDELYGEVQARGGSVEYVHGAGVRLAHLMADEHGAGLDVLRRLKAALDPSGTLNPGKLGL